jgi:hypothetical protein
MDVATQNIVADVWSAGTNQTDYKLQQHNKQKKVTLGISKHSRRP